MLKTVLYGSKNQPIHACRKTGPSTLAGKTSRAPERRSILQHSLMIEVSTFLAVVALRAQQPRQRISPCDEILTLRLRVRCDVASLHTRGGKHLKHNVIIAKRRNSAPRRKTITKSVMPALSQQFVALSLSVC